MAEAEGDEGTAKMSTWTRQNASLHRQQGQNFIPLKREVMGSISYSFGKFKRQFCRDTLLTLGARMGFIRETA